MHNKILTAFTPRPPHPRTAYMIWFHECDWAGWESTPANQRYHPGSSLAFSRECDANHIIKWGIRMTFTRQRVTLKHECVRQNPLLDIPPGSRNIPIVCQWERDWSHQSKHQGLMFVAILDQKTTKLHNFPEDESVNHGFIAGIFHIGTIISCIVLKKTQITELWWL